MKTLAAAVVGGLTLVAILYGCALQPRFEGASGAHFDGVRFHNRLSAEKSLFDVFVFMSTFALRREPWPDRVENGTWTQVPLPTDGFRVTFINHSTVLIETAAVNILTDPIWSERASPFSFAGPARVRKPGMPMSALPPIDLILISHDHYDHLDIASLQALGKHGRDGPPRIVVGLGNAALLREVGISNVTELDWWESVNSAGVEVIFAEVRHRSGRGLVDQMKSLWGGFVVRTAAGQLYFAGDTGYGPHFAETRARYGDFDLCLLPIGAYRPRSFMAPVHLDPADAVRAHVELGSRQSVAIHHGTFQLTYEAIDEPYTELQRAISEEERVAPDEFRVLGFGESLQVRGPPRRVAARTR